MLENLKEFLQNSYTAYHAVDNAKALLRENGFLPLSEGDDWELEEGGKYYVERGGCALIAFCVGNLDQLFFKVAAAHVDSPALKLKENPVMKAEATEKLNAETYGGGLWYSFLDRPLKIAGRIVAEENDTLVCENVVSPYQVSIPSLAIHQNRSANDGLTLNPQVDLLPLLGMGGAGENWLSTITDKQVLSYDLFLVNADTPYSFGVANEFIASPRIDDLACVYAILEALCSHAEGSDGICMGALFDNEEIGSHTAQGAAGDFMENTLRRITYALKLDETELYKALSGSVLVSADNAHASHPNHPEKADPTNRVQLGGGVVIKSHAGKAYTTDALSSAIFKKICTRAGVKTQSFYNRSDVRSGSTLGALAQTRMNMLAVDIGLPQLAMHSANECFAAADYEEMQTALTAFFSSNISINGNEVKTN
jgi:aspartyl aminopeptidase